MSKISKKIITLILSTITIMSMVACGEQKPAEPTEEKQVEEAQVEEEPQIEEEPKAEEEPQVTAITMEMTLKVGDVLELKAIAQPQEATEKEIIFESDNAEVAAVDEHGAVTAIGAGEANITAKASNGVSSAIKLIVEPKPEPEIKQTKAETQNETKTTSSLQLDTTGWYEGMQVSRETAKYLLTGENNEWTVMFDDNGNPILFDLVENARQGRIAIEEAKKETKEHEEEMKGYVQQTDPDSIVFG